MTRFRLLLLALIVALSGSWLAAPGTLALQGNDCEGIDAYIVALESGGEALAAAIPVSDDSSMDSWTSEDFTAASVAIEAERETFSEVEPPEIAAEFHALLLEQVGVLGQMFETMATTGVFGALIYIEQMNALDTQLDDAAQVVEVACGVDLTDTFNDATSATPVAVDGETAVLSDAGTRANPIPLGQTTKIHPDWEMTVVSVTPDATDLILGENSFNDPPATGQQFFLATVRLTYIGETSDEFYVSDLNAVGQSAVSYNQFDDYCGSIPDELPSRELFTGGTIEGNVCWSVQPEDANSLMLFDNYGDKEDRVFLSLVPDESPAAIATPVSNNEQR